MVQGFKRTQHMLGSHVVEVAADGASAKCSVALQLTFILPNTEGGPIYQVWGGFDYSLLPVAAAAVSPASTASSPTSAAPTERRWRAAQLKLNVYHTEGNSGILALAGKNVAAAAAAASSASSSATATPSAANTSPAPTPSASPAPTH
jgi:hypothetical protein